MSEIYLVGYLDDWFQNFFGLELLRQAFHFPILFPLNYLHVPLSRFSCIVKPPVRIFIEDEMRRKTEVVVCFLPGPQFTQPCGNHWLRPPVAKIPKSKERKLHPCLTMTGEAGV